MAARPWAVDSEQRGLREPPAELKELGKFSASTEKCSYLERSAGGRLFGFSFKRLLLLFLNTHDQGLFINLLIFPQSK